VSEPTANAVLDRLTPTCTRLPSETRSRTAGNASPGSGRR
jgi:hypothetical protein